MTFCLDSGTSSNRRIRSTTISDRWAVGINDDTQRLQPPQYKESRRPPLNLSELLEEATSGDITMN
jgi:hypothetical protein